MQKENERKYNTELTTKFIEIEAILDRIDKQMYSNINSNFPFYREFRFRDPNAMIKIFSGYIIELSFLKHNEKQNFTKDIESLISYTGMLKCQELLNTQRNEKELRTVFKEFVEEIYQEKNRENNSGNVIYQKMFEKEKYNTFVILMGRGILQQFLCKVTTELNDFCKKTKMDRAKLEGKVMNVETSLNLEFPLLEILAKEYKINFSYSSSNQKVTFPYIFKYDTDKTLVVLQAGDYFHILYERALFQQEKLSKDQMNKMSSDNDGFALNQINSSPKKSHQLNSGNKDYYDYISNQNYSGGHSKPQQVRSSGTIPTEYNASTTVKSFEKMDGLGGDEIVHADELMLTCPFCGDIQTDVDYYRAKYCKACRNYQCKQCNYAFSRKKPCSCSRCLCCFKNKPTTNLLIGEECSQLCHNCFESGDQMTQILRRYECGHKVCNLCLMIIEVQNNFNVELNKCVICNS